MITPTFKVEQDDNSITIIINTPYVRAQDVDLHVSGTEFRFFLRPYFLRLYLPANVVEDDDSKAVYDPSLGQFTVKVSKENKGEHFPDLDLLTKLLARRGEAADVSVDQAQPKKPLIEVIGSQDNKEDVSMEESTDQIENEFQKAADFNWELPQELPADDLMIHSVYGFNNQYSGYFTHVQETMNEIIDIREPEKSTIESRRQDRLEQEELKFDEDYYAMDFVNDEEIQNAIKYKTIWSKELKRIQKQAKEEEQQKKQNEKTLMRSLPNKEYLLSNEKVTYLGLVDLLFAYSYNHRVSEGDNTVESVWCVGKLSPTISCLEVMFVYIYIFCVGAGEMACTRKLCIKRIRYKTITCTFTFICTLLLTSTYPHVYIYIVFSNLLP
ncbi:SHQ1 protein-domain-containing protein [Phycomyces blakesleeanus]|uniref:SHQ1 protein-domain-containing protein n=1 Tax=Phycomyces blakesleeanus TaxID=4837 RepID=A0ABR3B238_PHYBL